MLDRLSDFSLTASGADYRLVRDALRLITEEARAQPDVERIAAALRISSGDLTALFRRWCGLTPKAFLQAVDARQRQTPARSGPAAARCRL